MEDVIQTYMLPYDPDYPVVCFDEASKQLFGEVRRPRRPRRGDPARGDHEYGGKGVGHQLMMCEPLAGKIEWHYTPKHGSWLNMAETEIGIMNSQCLDRRLDSAEKVAAEVAPWEGRR